MRIDFHSHVKISKKSSFMPDYFQEMMEEAKQNGLTALAMTEHFNTSRFYDIYQYLDRHFSYRDNYYHVNGLKLFPGIEVDVRENGHVLLIGNREDILSIREQLEPHIKEEQFIAFDRLMEITGSRELLRIGAHPFRSSTPLAENLIFEQLKKLDALDLNGKDLYAKGITQCQSELEPLAEKLNLPIVGGSDTHQFLQYGSIMNTFQHDCFTVHDIKKEITAGRYNLEISDQLSLKVRAATLVKKYMKKSIKEEQSLSI